LFIELFRHTVDFENNYNQVEGSQISQEEKEKLHQQMVTFFLGHVILVKVLEDINNVSADYLDKKGIRGYHIRNLLRLTTDSGLILDQEYKISEYLAIASGTIRPGELVQGDVHTFVKVSGVLIDLKEYEDAIRYFDSIIENEGDLNLLKMAWNNKGLCLLRLKRCEDAIPYFEKVITHDPTHLQALTNLAHCLDSVGRSEEANDVKDELQKLKRKQAIT
jgi:tetratricopeptide (TPR) repeat protein